MSLVCLQQNVSRRVVFRHLRLAVDARYQGHRADVILLDDLLAFVAPLSAV
jgi:hypothetical protein